MHKHKAAKPASVNTCREVTALIESYITGQLAPDLRREFQRHLSLCPDCVNFLKTYKKTAALSGAFEPMALPAKVRENVLDFLRKKMRRLAAFLLCLANQLFA